MYNKRGQLSVETMIIYGFVILVALSVLGFLIYFKVLDLGAYLPDSCNLGGTGDLKCEEMKLTSSVFELGIRNIGQRPIESLSLTATDDLGIHFTTVSGQGMTASGSQISFSNPLVPGDVGKVSILITGGKPGKVLRGTLRTTYKYKEGVVMQEASGNIRLKAVG